MKRQKIDKFFFDLSLKLFDHRLKIIISCLVFVTILAIKIPSLQFNMTNESFLEEDGHALTVYRDFIDKFGQDEFAILGISSSSIFDLKNLERLEALHKDLENNGRFVSKVVSLYSVPFFSTNSEGLEISTGKQLWPRNEADLATFESLVRKEESFKNRLVSDDYKFYAFFIHPAVENTEANLDDVFSEIEGDGFESPLKFEELSERENREFVKSLELIISKHQSDDFQPYLFGNPVISKELYMTMIQEVSIFTTLCVIIISVILYLLFRNLSAIFFAFSIVVFSIIGTIGICAWYGTVITFPFQVLPSMVTAIGIADSVHVLTYFFKEFQTSGDKRDAIAKAISKNGLAISLTTLSTFAGMISFVVGDIPPVIHLGVYAAIGVLLAYIFTILLLPALISIFPIKKLPPKADNALLGFFDGLLGKLANVSCKYPKTVVIGSFLVLLVGLSGLKNIRFSNDPMEWFGPDTSVSQRYETFRKALKGTSDISIMVDSGTDNGVKDPDFLKRLDSVQQRLNKISVADIEITNTLSLIDSLSRIHEELKPGERLPSKRDQVAQELFLLENSQDGLTSGLVDTNYRYAQVKIMFPWQSSDKFVAISSEVRNIVRSEFGEDFQVTGTLTNLSEVMEKLISTGAKSYLLAGLVINLMMIFVLGSPKIAAIAVLPNVTPILFGLGLLSWGGFPVDASTIIVLGVAIGLTVDDTIHFFHHFQINFKKLGKLKEALKETISETGRALTFTTFMLCAGFLPMAFSNLENLFVFGTLTAVILVVALVMDLFLMPSLMVLFFTPQAKEQLKSKQL